MLKPDNPRQLAVDLLPRSICEVRTAACIADGRGRIISWGWNSMGFDGFGEHAEAAAVRRANKKRLSYSIVYVAAERGAGNNPIFTRPCEDCQRRLRGYGIRAAVYRTSDGEWIREELL